jgi:hypothetical protein
MESERIEMIKKLECEDICTLEDIGRLKNNAQLRKIKSVKHCRC